MRKPKKIIKPRTKAKATTKVQLTDRICFLEAEINGAKKIIDAMQTEIKQLTNMHRTQLQIIDNLSVKIRGGF